MKDVSTEFIPAVNEEIFDLRPDYCAIGVVAIGLDNVARHPVVDRYVEGTLKSGVRAPWAAEHMEAWHAAYRAFGAKPQRTPDAMKNGEPDVETVTKGEVVWTDDRGVTCRGWNWRQGIRTRIDLQTCRAWFVLDRLAPMPIDAATDAAVALNDMLRQMSPASRLSVHRIDRVGTTDIS